jgi:hypothetical protein
MDHGCTEVVEIERAVVVRQGSNRLVDCFLGDDVEIRRQPWGLSSFGLRWGWDVSAGPFGPWPTLCGGSPGYWGREAWLTL